MTGSKQRSLCQDDEEWDDYRENKKDFTGLKIDKLVIEEPVNNTEEEETEVSQDHFNRDREGWICFLGE